MRKPNYNIERQDRERAKQAKAAAKENRSVKRDESGHSDVTATDEHVHPSGIERQKSEG